MPAPEIPRRVTLLCRSVGLGVDLLALLVEECAIDVISAPQELARGGAPADVVVVDVPAEDRGAVCEAVRSYYRGQLIVLLSPGDDSHDLPPDRMRTLLSRPFSMHDLAAVLTASGQGLPASDPVAPPRLLLPPGAKDRGATTGRDDERITVAQAVPQLRRSMGQRRLVRMSAILAAAALAFVAAFGLANQHHRCRPHCDELAGAGALTSSSGTTVQAVGDGPATIDSGVDVASPTTTSSSGALAAVGGSGSDVATRGGTRSSSTTSRPGGLPSPTAPSASTRPQPSSSVSTAPTTTRSKPTTTTTSSTTTTTTTTTVPGQLGR